MAVIKSKRHGDSTLRLEGMLSPLTDRSVTGQVVAWRNVTDKTLLTLFTTTQPAPAKGEDVFQPKSDDFAYVYQTLTTEQVRELHDFLGDFLKGA